MGTIGTVDSIRVGADALANAGAVSRVGAICSIISVYVVAVVAFLQTISFDSAISEKECLVLPDSVRG